MINANVTNAWKIEQALLIRDDLVNGNLTMTQIRRRMQELTVQNFVGELAVAMLKHLYLQRTVNDIGDLNVPCSKSTECDAEFAGYIGHLMQKGKWPLKRKRVEQYHEGILKRFRLHYSSQVQHKMLYLPTFGQRSKEIEKKRKSEGTDEIQGETEDPDDEADASKLKGTELKRDRIKWQHTRRACALCSSTGIKRETMFECESCQVPLCNKPLSSAQLGSKSCFEKWHSVEDLKRERSRRQRALDVHRQS